MTRQLTTLTAEQPAVTGTGSGAFVIAWEAIKRRWPVVLACIVLTPVIGAGVTSQQTPMYTGSAQVTLSRQNLAAALTNTADGNSFSAEPNRLVQTQADVAASSGVLAALPDVPKGRPQDTPEVTGDPDSDLLTFEVTSYSEDRAVSLTNMYAKSYIAYRRRLDAQPLASAEREVEARLRSLRSSSPLYTSLVSRLEQLRTLQTLQTANATIIQPAVRANQTAPRTFRAGLVGLVGGLLLAAVLAAAFETFDTRVRRSDEVEAAVDAPLLGQVPKLKTSIVGAGLLAADRGALVRPPEAFQLARTTLDLVRNQQNARTLMITSAMMGEGKTTTTANLASAFALAGRSVVLVDFDVIRPQLTASLALEDRPGLTDAVFAGQDPIEALVDFPLGETASGGSLRVLPVGTSRAMPFDLTTFEGFDAVLNRLVADSDLVIFDTAPLLQVSDSLALAQLVDMVTLVARLNVVTRPALGRIAKLVNQRTLRISGVIVLSPDSATGSGYGYGYGYGTRPAFTAAERA